MSSTFLVIGFILFLLISAGWGILRGLSKSRVRGICVIVSAVAAVVTTLILKQTFLSDSYMNEQIIPYLQELGQAQISELLNVSPTLCTVLMSCVTSLLAPLVCVVLFLVYSFLTWIIYLVISLVFGVAFKAHNANSRFRLPRAAAWGVIQALVIFVILLLPISAYVEIAPLITDELLEAKILDDETNDMVAQIMDDEIKPLNENGLLTVYRTLGGKPLANLLTDFEVNGTKTHLQDEIGAVASLGCNIYTLGQVEFKYYGEKEAATIIAIADSFDQSVLLPTIAGEIIYGATDSWLKGDAFLGAEKPSLGEMNDIFEPFLDTLFRVLNTDAQNYRALQADIRTLAEMVSVLAEKGIFASLDNTEALMEALAAPGIIDAMVTSLGTNQSMSVLIPEITNMGIRAIATTLGIPADVDAVYGDFMNDVTTALNAAKTSSDPVAAVTQSLTAAFDEAGIPIDTQIVDCYSVSMVEDLIEESGDAEITAADVQAFFAIYAMNVTTPDGSQDPTEGVAVKGTFPLTGEHSLFEGTVYENKSEEDLKNSGAAVLAKVCQELANIEITEETDLAAEASLILQEAYTELLAEKPEAMAVIVSVQVTVAVSTSSVEVTAGLQAADQMVTQKVTMSDLLIDSEAAAEGINAETVASEAQAIASMFVAANDLMKNTSDTSNMDITTIASSVGQVLDSLSNTSSFGSDKTADLFTAVLQSETVRNTADMDMATATQMAQKATEGDVNYTQTMNAVSGSINVMSQLGKDGQELSEEELTELIRNINPQTAGMIEVYITAERIVGYGVPVEYSAHSAELIQHTFSYMGRNDITDYESEAKALNQVLNVALAAKKNSSSQKDLFGGVLPNATETVDIFMASHAVSYGFRKTILDDNGNVKDGMYDPYDLSDKIPENSEDYNELMAALDKYYSDPNHQTEETKLTLKALAALFGVEVTPSVG